MRLGDVSGIKTGNNVPTESAELIGICLNELEPPKA